MTEEVETEKATPGASESTPDVNPVETLAQKLGWKADFDGDSAVDAETFILRSRDINSSLGKTVKSLRNELTAVKEGMEVVQWNAERSYKGEMTRLKSEIAALKIDRKKAIEDGNVSAVEQFDDQLKDLDEATKDVPREKKKADGPVPEYVEWVEDNPWYETDLEMQRYANALRDTPDYKAVEKASFSRMLKKVSKAVKKEFADKFPGKEDTVSASVATSQAAPVTPSRQRAKPPKTKATAADLTYEQRNVGKDFVAMKVFKTLDEYAQSLQEKNEGGN